MTQEATIHLKQTEPTTSEGSNVDAFSTENHAGIIRLEFRYGRRRM